MKKNNLFLLYSIICISLLSTCNKKSDILQTTSGDDNSSERISTTPSYRGLYVADFDNILGDTAQENNLLRWCKKYKIKTISLYDLNTVLQNSSNNTALAKFIKKSKTSFGMKQVTAIRGSGTGFSQLPKRKVKLSTSSSFSVRSLL
ncbi:MAG: hypothetical protein ABIT08_06725 [Bacteroidia bacterium]